MVLLLNFGMIHGARDFLGKITSQSYTIFPVIRKLQWLSCCLFEGENYNWNISFIPVQDWELELFVSLTDLIYLGSLRRNGMDKICWKLSPWGTFDVRSYYKALQPLNSFSLLWKPLRKPNELTKVSF